MVIAVIILVFQAGSSENVSPVISTPHHYLINIYRGDIFFIAVTQSEGKELSTFYYINVV